MEVKVRQKGFQWLNFSESVLFIRFKPFNFDKHPRNQRIRMAMKNSSHIKKSWFQILPS